MNKHIRWILQEWKQQKKFILIMVILTVVSALVSIAYPYMFKIIIDKLKDITDNVGKYPEPMKEVYRILWLLGAIGLGQLIAGIYPAFRAWVNYRFEFELRTRYFRYISEKDARFFTKFRTGDLVTRLTNDITDFPKIAWFLCSGIFRAFNSLISIIFMLIVMFQLNLHLTIYSLIPLPLMLIVFYFVMKSLQERYANNQRAISKINDQLEMSFSAIHIIKAFACEEKYNRFFDTSLEHRRQTEIKLIQLNATIMLLWEYISYFAQIAVIIFGGMMAVKGTITIGTFMAFYTYLGMMIYPLLDLPQLFLSGKQAFVNMDRLEEIREYPTSLDRFIGEVSPGDELNSIELAEINFQYDASPIFKDVNLKIDPHKRTLLLGGVGTGKTTLIEIITGMLMPDSGNVNINGIALQQLKRQDYLQMLGYVPQEPLLFSGSIKENIHFAAENATENDYKAAILTAQMTNEIDQMDEGDKTDLQERGTNVSGGQKQRLTIARALIRRPKYLIFDDITASLDAQNEMKLWEAMNEYYPDTGALVVSHRISTIQYADMIIFIKEDGNVISGTHNILLDQDAEYRSFVSEIEDYHKRN
ncbi:MAG: ABC transporter ATP-binding protein/permease [Candidatus Cloacimonetes bacterium]|nr:ABC transporter ATP-binding protein/permease [Candidatus Cloacimonadota bacterium]